MIPAMMRITSSSCSKATSSINFTKLTGAFFFMFHYLSTDVIKKEAVISFCSRWQADVYAGFLLWFCIKQNKRKHIIAGKARLIVLSLSIPVTFKRKETMACTQAESLLNDGKIDAVVVDGSNSLWKGSFAEYYGKQCLKRSLLRAHFNTFRAGTAAKKQIKEIAKTEGEAAAISAVCTALVGNKLGKKAEMEKNADEFLRKRETGEVVVLLRKAKEKNIPIVLATIEGSTIAEAAQERYGITCVVSNKEMFGKNRMLSGVEMIINNGEEKATATTCALGTIHCKIERSMVVGDSMMLDGPLLRIAGRCVASPYATQQVREIKGIFLLRE